MKRSSEQEKEFVNHYAQSWEIYKAHSQEFKDDYAYYYNFTKGYSTLELFAGYGRLSNYLWGCGVDLETVELEPNFAKYIELPPDKNHVADVLTYQPTRQFERVIAGYNSFCLFTNENDIEIFFRQLDAFLKPGGLASLNYYHQDYWKHASSYSFEFKGMTVNYEPSFDLSKAVSEHRGLWIDRYKFSGNEERCEYPTRIYHDKNEFCFFLKNTNLELVEEVKEFREENVSEPGWIDYVLRKKC